MARLSKTQIAAREEVKVRVDKATQSTLAALGKLIEKHMPGLIGAGAVDTSFTITGFIKADGSAAARIEYQTKVSDGCSFALDDGQEEPPAPDEDIPLKPRVNETLPIPK